MGRLGGREMGFASDADVLFVHDPLPGADEEAASRAAHSVAETLRALLATPRPDPALPVDAGLRPEGRQGPLVRTLGLLPRLLPALVGVLGGAGPAAGRVRGRGCRGRRRVPGAGRRVPLPRGRDRRGVGPGDPADQGPHGGRADAARHGPGPEPEARAGRAGRRGVGGAAHPAPARPRGARAAHHRDPDRPGRRPARPGWPAPPTWPRSPRPGSSPPGSGTASC